MYTVYTQPCAHRLLASHRVVCLVGSVCECTSTHKSRGQLRRMKKQTAFVKTWRNRGWWYGSYTTLAEASLPLSEDASGSMDSVMVAAWALCA